VTKSQFCSKHLENPGQPAGKSGKPPGVKGGEKYRKRKGSEGKNPEKSLAIFGKLRYIEQKNRYKNPIQAGGSLWYP